MKPGLYAWFAWQVNAPIIVKKLYRLRLNYEKVRFQSEEGREFWVYRNGPSVSSGRAVILEVRKPK